RYIENNASDIATLFPSVIGLPECPWGPWISTARWPWVLIDALRGLANGHFHRSRDHLVALYVSRLMTFWQEIEHRTNIEVANLLHQQFDDIVKVVAKNSMEFSGPPESAALNAGYWGEIQSEWNEVLRA
ncbi:MAG: hypothetical protein ACRDTD_27065, partial [Pseudonocardiaceae bacterium]